LTYLEKCTQRRLALRFPLALAVTALAFTTLALAVALVRGSKCILGRIFAIAIDAIAIIGLSGESKMVVDDRKEGI
jgi:hypothetical protein